MIYITTRYGLYCYSESQDEPRQLLDNNDLSTTFSRQSRGIFGISWHDPSDRLLFASQEHRKFPWFGRWSRKRRLHFYDPTSDAYSFAATVNNLYDVHQITSHDQEVFIADAVENRVVRYDLDSNKQQGELHVGPVRQDLHHVNTVLIHDGHFWIGLNQSPEGHSKIIKLPLQEILDKKGETYDVLEHGEIINIHGISDTHDLVPFRDTFLISASHDSYVFDLKNQDKLLEGAEWTRGITLERDNIWVGSSELAKREERHRRSNGNIYCFSSDSFELKEKQVLPGSGQVYDMITVEE
ncbi:MAG: hypothetical protein ABEK50_08270 [bacterium]